MRYLKPFVLLLATNVLLAGMLCMTRGSFIYAQKQTTISGEQKQTKEVQIEEVQTEEVQMEEVIIQTQNRISNQRTVPCKILTPQYVIHVSE